MHGLFIETVTAKNVFLFFLSLVSRDVFWHELILQTVVFVETATSLQQASLLQDFLMFFRTRFVLENIWHKNGNVFFFFFFSLHFVAWSEHCQTKKLKVKDINSSNGTKFARDETRKVRLCPSSIGGVFVQRRAHTHQRCKMLALI